MLYKNKKSGNNLSSQQGNPQIFSAHWSLTSVFGMGTGITSMLSSPEMYCKMLSIITYYNWIHFVLYYIAKKNTSIYTKNI